MQAAEKVKYSNDPLVPGKDKFRKGLFPELLKPAQEAWIYYHIPTYTPYFKHEKKWKEKISDARSALNSVIFDLKEDNLTIKAEMAYSEYLKYAFFASDNFNG